MTTAVCQSAGLSIPADRERARFTAMLRLRRFEEKAGMLYALGTLASPCPLGIGQEAALAALATSLEPSDAVLALDLNPALDLALGAAPAALFERFLPPAGSAQNGGVLLREPGGEPRRLPYDDAITALSACHTDHLVVLSSDPMALTSALPQGGRSVSAVLVIPSDRKPDTWPPAWNGAVRECDGADVEAIAAALAAVREECAVGHGTKILAILTPPYAGHARDGNRRPAARRDTPDPLALYRYRLVTTGRLTDAEAIAMEATARDEIAAAGRAISLSCAP